MAEAAVEKCLASPSRSLYIEMRILWVGLYRLYNIVKCYLLVDVELISYMVCLLSLKTSIIVVLSL